MTRVRFTELAELDLEQIADDIADDAGTDRAIAVLTDFESAVELLAEWPGAGHELPDLADDELRF